MDEHRGEIEALRATVRDLEARVEVLSLLEERVRVAEARASDAERRLQELIDQVRTNEAVQDDGPAGDLRARLARTASRKKPGARDER